MKKSPYIAAALGLLTIAHQSEARFLIGDQGAGDIFLFQAGDFSRIRPSYQERQLGGWGEKGFVRTAPAYVSLPQFGKESDYPYTRGLETTGEEEEEAAPSNLFHINLQDLSSLLDCQYGCKAAFALISSDQCNSTDAQDSALEFKLQEELTVDKTHIEIDEDAPDYGWATRPFRELMTDATDNTADSSAPPMSLTEFVAAAAMVSEFIDAMTPDQDYNLAVYLYNNETEPLACTTLELVTDDEGLQEYYNLFGGGGDGGEDGSDVGEGGEKPVAAVGNDSSLLSEGLLAYAVAGVSAVMSAILFA